MRIISISSALTVARIISLLLKLYYSLIFKFARLFEKRKGLGWGKGLETTGERLRIASLERGFDAR